MVRLSPVDEKMHSTLRGLLLELQRTLTPLSETYVSIEVHLRALLANLDESNPTATVALLGMKGSGKSALLNSVMRCPPLLPSHTKHTLTVRPAVVSGVGEALSFMDSHSFSVSDSAVGSGIAAARLHRQMRSAGANQSTVVAQQPVVHTTAGEEPFIRLFTGRAIAKGVEGCRDHLETENTQFLKELSERYLSVSLPILAERDTLEIAAGNNRDTRASSFGGSSGSGSGTRATPAQQNHTDEGSISLDVSHMGSASHTFAKRSLMLWAADIAYLDCSSECCSYAAHSSIVAMQVRDPNILSASVLWNCIDARLISKIIETLLPREDSVYRHFSDSPSDVDDQLLTGRFEAVHSFATKEEAADALNAVLYHVLSKCNDDAVSVDGTVQRALRLTTFIITHVDSLLLEGQGRVRSIECSERVAIYETPVRNAVRDGFCKLFHLASNGRLTVQKSRVLLYSAPTVATTLNLLLSDNPTIKDIYDFAEENKGLGFMQTIDGIEESQLRRIIHKLATDEVYVKCGAKAVLDAMRLLDYNSARHWMMRIACNGAECVEQLRAAVVAARPIIKRQLETTKSDLEVLAKELDWSVSAAHRVRQFCTKTLIESLVTFANAELDRFLAGRLEELRYVMEHRELAWFKERQACTITEMSAKLRKLEAFTDRYMTQRGFLEKKHELLLKAQSRSNQIGSDAEDSYNNYESEDSFSVNAGSRPSRDEVRSEYSRQANDNHAAMTKIDKRIQRLRQQNTSAQTPEPTVVLGTSNFLEGNIDALLDSMEVEKEERLTDLFLGFCHHVRDEYMCFVPTLLEGLQSEKRKLIHRLAALIEDPITEAEARLGRSFDIEGALELIDTTNLVEENVRRLNSFLRELPGHAAAAAVEISNQWYSPVDSVTVKGVDVTLPLGAGSSRATTAATTLVNHPIPQAFATNISTGDSTLTEAAIAAAGPATTGAGGRVSAQRQLLFPARPAPLPNDANREAHHVVHPHLLYVYECWRVTFDAVELHQLSNYNVHTLTVAATKVNNAVVDFINSYVENIEEGASSHRESISHLEASEDMIAATVEICEELTDSFDHLINSLESTLVTDVAVARKVAQDTEDWCN